jgi:hypothetical protein
MYRTRYFDRIFELAGILATPVGKYFASSGRARILKPQEGCVMEERTSITAPQPNLDMLRMPAADLASWGFSPADWKQFSGDLTNFNLPSAMVQPLLRAFRGINTLADALFYDVGLLWLRLYTRGVNLSTNMQQPAATMQDSLAALQAAAKFINLSALANPEGAILVINAHQAPFVHKYTDVTDFLNHGLTFPPNVGGQAPYGKPRDIHIVTVTGVGSSALGSAAFAWNVSEALHRPVAAIVPGYGLADLLPQALGGWFGFGVHDFLRRTLQQALNEVAPEVAGIGHELAATIPTPAAVPADAAFRSGSPESDILHQILLKAPKIKRLYGHSKGALCIANAIRGLPPDRYEDLHVTTLGCVIQEETDADYNQILGRVDSLGQLNSWGNWPEQWIDSWHSTNTMLPRTMPVADLVTKDLRDEDPVKVDPKQLRDALTETVKEILAPYLSSPGTQPS